MTRTTCQKRYLVLNFICFYCEYIKSKFDLIDIAINLAVLNKREIGKVGFDPAISQFPMAIFDTNYLFPLHCFVVLFLIHHLHRLNVVLLVLLHYFQSGN